MKGLVKNMLRIAKTENGMVRGIPAADPRITAFKGIPFAAPPIGELRWKAPQPAANWEGVRDCFTFAPIAMQAAPGADPNAFYSKEWHVDPEQPMSEDCLYLNVWTPAKTGDEKLPVMFWIFGGGYQSGYPSEMEFDGERFARRGVVFVSVNYRVNIFGFLAHPDITAENPDGIPGNFGLQDQIAGMKWVKRNISAFGGDPENITIFGQSAGAGSVMHHITSPLTVGLFQKAILQSAAGVLAPAGGNFTLEKAEQTGKKFFDDLGIKSIAEARQLSAEELFGMVMKHGVFLFQAITDGRYSTELTYETLMKGTYHKIPILTGHTKDEFPVVPRAESVSEFEEWARGKLGDYADRYIAYCKEGTGSVAEMIKKGTLNIFEIGDLLWCESNAAKGGSPLYCYKFEPEYPGDNAGDFHSSELWFTFETLAKCWRPFKGKHYDLARQMCNYWTNFAKTGDPNGLDADGTTMPEWPPYTSSTPYMMRFGDETELDRNEWGEMVKYFVSCGYDIIKHLYHKMGR